MSQCTRIFIVIAIVLCHARSEDLQWNVEDHPAWKIIDKFECGYSASDRIIGGLTAVLGQFPWIARLGYSIQDDRESEWLCGGALVTDKHVITAAHCVQITDEDFELTFVRLGEYDTVTNPDCQLHVCAPPVQDRKIEITKIHSNYNKPSFHNDLALITLNEPVQLNDYVMPICLPRGEQLDTKLNEHVTIAGWGKTNMTTEEKARVLQYVSVPITKPESCDFFGKGFKLSKSEICAGGQRNKDACVGDSGGPLMKVFDTPDGPKSVLMGIVSFGPTICGIKARSLHIDPPLSKMDTRQHFVMI